MNAKGIGQLETLSINRRGGICKANFVLARGKQSSSGGSTAACQSCADLPGGGVTGLGVTGLNSFFLQVFIFFRAHGFFFIFFLMPLPRRGVKMLTLAPSHTLHAWPPNCDFKRCGRALKECHRQNFAPTFPIHAASAFLPWVT